MNTIESAFDTFVSTFNSHELERFCACLTPDVSVYPPPQAGISPIEGGSAVKAYFGKLFEAATPMGPIIRQTNVQVRRLNEHAAFITFEFPGPQGSTARRTLVLRQEAGGWLVAHIHASSADAPAARA